MTVDYKRFLAENVLNERRTVTYRLLSRALKVHSTLAKQMLYEFHRTENAKKFNSVNATYVITGFQKPPESLPPHGNLSQDNNGDDDAMQSSSYISSSMPTQDVVVEPGAIAAIVLVRGEELDEAKAMFQAISSIHVYSLQPAVLEDLNVLTDASREIVATYGNEDPLEFGKQWGMIQNGHVKRRTGPPAALPQASGPVKAAPAKATVPTKRPLQKEEPIQSKGDKKSEDADLRQPSQSIGTPHLEGRPQSPKPAEHTAPKKEKNSIFSSFAKAKPKQKKEEPATPVVSGAESAEPSGPEDVALDDASEEEPEELFPDTGRSTSTANRETKREREDKLKKMMEEDDDEEMPDAAEPPEPTIDQPPTKQPELKEEVTTHGGRRRGKRQVMKKKMVKDDEGYLVTVEEPTWESFSEDEPEPPKKKPAVSGGSNTSKKSAGKAGQGNIMSFFSKK
ncbi:hypothetical protein PHISCL_09056 [Aspergillus sclerotialis]|uniref:DNA polymerase delta subunit 3 n=1 Tax=Aspergillus sclerotialis TaxID=2070753 RepID=A0A3A2ZND9_9EURO|nr:hypothetical protein PHISCL_09056 [Aspergillus sclerotialis]